MPARPRVEIGHPPEHALRRVDEIEAAAPQLPGKRLCLRLDPEDLRPAPARLVEHCLGRIDRGHDGALLGELGARLAGPALQMEHPLRREIAQRRLHDRRQPGPRAPSAQVRVVERAAIVVGRFHQAGSEKPPSTMIVCPHTIAASSEQRNETAPAMSSALDEPAGGRALDRAEHLVLVREVLERAGVDDPARDGVHADRGRELDAEIAHDRFERGLRGADEHVVLEHAVRRRGSRSDDRRAGGIDGAVARVSASRARAFAFSVQSQWWSVVSSAGRITPVAALCTTTRYGPCDASSPITGSFETSPRTSTGSAPAARICAAASSAAASFRM